MFYILNFDNHKFVSCDNASIAEANIQQLLSTGTAAESLEIVNGFADNIRYDVHSFRNFCRDMSLVNEGIAPTATTSDSVSRASLTNMNSHEDYKEITQKQAHLILDYMEPFEHRFRPRLSESGFDFLSDSGKYFLREGDKYIGMDYSYDYEGFVEEFDSPEACFAWLNDEYEISDFDQWQFNHRNNIEQKPALELLIQNARQKIDSSLDSQKEQQTMTLSDFLSSFDFSYTVHTNDNDYENSLRKQLIDDGSLDEKYINAPLIGLIDEQAANLGNIQGDRFPIDHELASKILDRMSIYIEDGVVSEFVDAIESRDLNSSDLSLEEMVLICKELKIKEVSYPIAEMIITPEKIIIPETEQLSTQNKSQRFTTDHLSR